MSAPAPPEPEPPRALLDPASELGWPLALVDVAPGGRGPRLALDAESDALVLSVGPGVVTSIGVDDSLGRTVTIDHGDGLVARYGGLGEFLVHEGLAVVRGTAIGVPRTRDRGQTDPIVLELSLDGTLIDPLEHIGLPPPARR